MSAKGVTLNLEMTDNDGDCTLDIKCDTTDGFNFDYNIVGDDIESMIEECMDDFSESVLTYLSKKSEEKEEEESKEVLPPTEYEKELEKIIEKLTKENNSLKTDLKILQRRADDMVNQQLNKEKSVTKKSPKTNASSRYYLFDPFKVMDFWL